LNASGKLFSHLHNIEAQIKKRGSKSLQMPLQITIFWFNKKKRGKSNFVACVSNLLFSLYLSLGEN